MAKDSTTIRTTATGAAELRKLAGQLAAQTGRVVTAGQALEAAVALAGRDIAATVALLPTEVDR